MATQKKAGGSRAASGGSRSSGTGGRRTAPSSKSRSGSRRQEPAPRPYRRELGAVVCLLLAIFASFGYFNMQAIFIDLFCNLLKGLLGYGCELGRGESISKFGNLERAGPLANLSMCQVRGPLLAPGST